MSAPLVARPPSYVHEPAAHTTEEVSRLDALHTAQCKYFGDRLSFAPIYGMAPARIIDLGSGSGAWVNQAAKDFPKAEVIAVDRNPLPHNNFPPNLKFLNADLTHDLPFEDGSFDIVHVRHVFIHVPNSAKDLLARAARLLKPGGWLLVEENDIELLALTGGPAVSRLASTYGGIVKSYGADYGIARKLEGPMRSLGMFKEVNFKNLCIPISRPSLDEVEDQLRDAYRQTIILSGESLCNKFDGLTPELAVQVRKDMDNVAETAMFSIYFFWCRRSSC